MLSMAIVSYLPRTPPCPLSVGQGLLTMTNSCLHPIFHHLKRYNWSEIPAFALHGGYRK